VSSGGAKPESVVPLLPESESLLSLPSLPESALALTVSSAPPVEPTLDTATEDPSADPPNSQ
jgi:hypothetical protein